MTNELAVIDAAILHIENPAAIHIERAEALRELRDKFARSLLVEDPYALGVGSDGYGTTWSLRDEAIDGLSKVIRTLADAALVVAAVNALPGLLDELAALQAQNESLAARLQAAEARCAELERELSYAPYRVQEWLWHEYSVLPPVQEIERAVRTPIAAFGIEVPPPSEPINLTTTDAALHGQKDGRDG